MSRSKGMHGICRQHVNAHDFHKQIDANLHCCFQLYVIVFLGNSYTGLFSWIECATCKCMDVHIVFNLFVKSMDVNMLFTNVMYVL